MAHLFLGNFGGMSDEEFYDEEDDILCENNDYNDEDELEFHGNQGDYYSPNEDDDSADENSSAVDPGDSHMYLPRDHPSEVMRMLKKQYDQKEHLDLSIQTSESSTLVHKCLLAACSPYVNTYLQNCSASKSIDLSHLNSECVGKIIEWCYTGFIKFSTANVQDFLVAADFLCIDQVFKNCTDFILKRLTLSNCYEIYSFACSFQACDFKTKVKRYILNHPVELFKHNLLGVVSKEEIVEIISDPSLVITDDDGYPMMDGDQEFRLFHLLQDYTTLHKLSSYWPELLKKGLRLSIMSEPQLKHIFESVEEMDECANKVVCVDILREALQCKKVKKAECLMWLKPRKNLERLRYYNSSELATSYLHEDQSEPIPFNDIDARKGGRLLFVTAMKVMVRNWMTTTVVGGVEITYNNGKVISHGGNEADWQVHQFSLEAGEKITSVVIRSGHVVDCLEFRTNRQRTWGPYGGMGGNERVLKPKPSNGFLATIKGCTVKSLDHMLIRRISFVWGYLKRKHTFANST